jgi:SAM-dependent methyltransferase
MPGILTSEITRRPFQGVTQILRYNWPYYALSLAGMAAGMVLRSLDLPRPLKTGVLAVTILAAFWLCSSVLVSLYVYDLSHLYRWDWLRRALPTAPQRWVCFHAGLDETSAALHRLFPSSDGSSHDFYDPARMQEHSIERARRSAARSNIKDPVDFRVLPFRDSSCDAAFLIFAAHEIRDSQDRVRFFKELRRILKPGGRLILVEHLRDVWNFAAFGPGVRHFFSRSEWWRTARSAGFSVSGEQAITPFVRCFVFDGEHDA